MKIKGVLLDAREQIEERRASPAYLYDAIPFERSLRLPEDKIYLIEKLLDKLIGTKGFYIKEQKLIDLEILIANLINDKKRPIAISLNRNNWKQSIYYRTSYFMIDLVYKLKEKGYIKMNIGYKNPKESRFTKITATDKLLEYCPRLSNLVISVPKELVELRDDNKKLIEYKNTAKTFEIRDKLARINEVNSKCDIRYHQDKINAVLVAVFNRKFTLYGRLHTRGYSHYQGLSGEERKELTINGESVVELDFSGLHPYLLYAKEEIQNMGDPYSIVNDNPIARPFLKHILLCLLNSENEIQAEKAANKWLLDNHKERILLESIGITRARPLIDSFKVAHKKISHYFCSGKETGLRIMNKDAAIALDIINHFGKQNIPILAIHDSFIVQEKHKSELLQTMKTIYKKHTGFRIKVK